MKLAASVDEKVYHNAGNSQVLRWVPANAKRVLDVGCGAGDNAQALAGRMVVDGITLSEREAVLARKFCERVWMYNLEYGLPAEAGPEYDVIIASHVLEHLCRPEMLLRGIAKCLAEDGLFIVALPNLLYWKNRWNLLCGRFDYAETGIMDNTHYKWYTFASAGRMLEAQGFVVEQAYADGNFPLPWVRRWFPAGVVRAVDQYSSRQWPGLFGWQMIYVARRRKAGGE
jgi:2-polyprenyl-3-methyl-5-hydroxy-6-metoxy-1,4-benzoquinol methylase